MNYKSIDELDTFEFHDSKIKDISITKSQISFQLSALNAKTNNSQNNSNSDLCIDDAQIIFHNAKICKIEFLPSKSYDNKNNSIGETKSRTAEKYEYSNIIEETIGASNSCFISMESFLKNDNKYTTCFCINSFDMYYLTISFDSVTVTWDNFSGVSWYESKRN